MAQVAPSPNRELTTVKVMLGIAILAASISATAGLLLILLAPPSGSATEAALGITAAVSGIATALVAGVAAIYAQVKDLWQYAPSWLKVVAWAVLVFAVVSSLWGSITRMN